jgi:hypothetical protein
VERHDPCIFCSEPCRAELRICEAASSQLLIGDLFGLPLSPKEQGVHVRKPSYEEVGSFLPPWLVVFSVILVHIALLLAIERTLGFLGEWAWGSGIIAITATSSMAI